MRFAEELWGEKRNEEFSFFVESESCRPGGREREGRKRRRRRRRKGRKELKEKEQKGGRIEGGGQDSRVLNQNPSLSFCFLHRVKTLSSEVSVPNHFKDLPEKKCIKEVEKSKGQAQSRTPIQECLRGRKRRGIEGRNSLK